MHIILLINFLLFSLVACSTGASSTNVQQQATAPVAKHLSPIPTKPPAGIVLYQADWSHGLSGWQGAHGWKVVQGHLETDTSGLDAFTIPYKHLVPDYALEIRIQIVRLLHRNGGYFSIAASKTPEKNGYNTGISSLEGSEPRPNGAHAQAQIFLDPASAAIQQNNSVIDYDPGSDWHTYRVEVQNNEVTFLANDVSLVDTSSSETNTLSNGPIVFSSAQLILRLSSLRILTL